MVVPCLSDSRRAHEAVSILRLRQRLGRKGAIQAYQGMRRICVSIPAHTISDRSIIRENRRSRMSGPTESGFPQQCTNTLVPLHERFPRATTHHREDFGCTGGIPRMRLIRTTLRTTRSRPAGQYEPWYGWLSR